MILAYQNISTLECFLLFYFEDSMNKHYSKVF